MKPLTHKQTNVLEFLVDFSGRQGFPPTLREIGEEIGLCNLNAVRGHLAALQKKGYITKASDKARAIQIVRTPSSFSRFKKKLHGILRTDEGVLHRVHYGLAWATWRRKKVFTGPLREVMVEAMEKEALEHGWTIQSKKIEPDHIVVVATIWPNHSPELVVRRFQGAGRALQRLRAGSSLHGRLWAKGYAATTELEILDELVDELLREQAADTAERGRRNA